MVDVLVGDHEQADFLHAATVRGERLFELVQRLRGVWAGVDERQRIVVDQVGVDSPNLKRRRDGEAMDALLSRARERGLCLLGRRGARRAHERISSSTSSRRRSMS